MLSVAILSAVISSLVALLIATNLPASWGEQRWLNRALADLKSMKEARDLPTGEPTHDELRMKMMHAYLYSAVDAMAKYEARALSEARHKLPFNVAMSLIGTGALLAYFVAGGANVSPRWVSSWWLGGSIGVLGTGLVTALVDGTRYWLDLRRSKAKAAERVKEHTELVIANLKTHLTTLKAILEEQNVDTDTMPRPPDDD